MISQRHLRYAAVLGIALGFLLILTWRSASAGDNGGNALNLEARHTSSSLKGLASIIWGWVVLHLKPGCTRLTVARYYRSFAISTTTI